MSTKPPENTGRAIAPNAPENEAEKAALRLRLESLAGEAVETLADMLADDELSPKNRLAVAVAVLDRAGYSPQTAKKEAGKGPLSLSDMTGAELSHAVDKIRRELAKRADGAKVIDGKAS